MVISTPRRIPIAERADTGAAVAVLPNLCSVTGSLLVASEELPIEASVIEAAAKAVRAAKVRDGDRNVVYAEAAIRAYQKAVGMTVERNRPIDVGPEVYGPGITISGPPPEFHPRYRLVSAWQPVVSSEQEQPQ